MVENTITRAARSYFSGISAGLAGALRRNGDRPGSFHGQAGWAIAGWDFWLIPGHVSIHTGHHLSYRRIRFFALDGENLADQRPGQRPDIRDRGEIPLPCHWADRRYACRHPGLTRHGLSHLPVHQGEVVLALLDHPRLPCLDHIVE